MNLIQVEITYREIVDEMCHQTQTIEMFASELPLSEFLKRLNSMQSIYEGFQSLKLSYKILSIQQINLPQIELLEPLGVGIVRSDGT